MASMWQIHLREVQDSLGTVYHLLKEEHSDEVDPNIRLLTKRKSVDDQKTDGKGSSDNSHTSKSVLGSWQSDGEVFWMQTSQENVPTSSSLMPNNEMMQMNGTGIDENGISNQIKIYTYSIYRRLSSPLSNNDSSENVDAANHSNPHLGDGSASSANTSWAVEAFLGESNIPTVHFREQRNTHENQSGGPSPSSDSLHRREPPVPQFQDQPHQEDPTLFHLNAFDSPPPSPGNELTDFVFNMQPDPNGMIPDIADMHDPIFRIQDDNNTHNAHVCRLELCRSFHHLLETTPENVQDKQNILKEILHHSHALMLEVVEHCPLDLKDKMREIRASIFLVNNSLQRSTTMESFEKTAETAKYLLIKIRTAIEEHL